MTYLLTKDNGLVYRNNGLVVGPCPECCGGGCATACCSGGELCGFPTVAGVNTIDMRFGITGSANSSRSNLNPPAGLPQNYFNFTNAVAINGVYLSPPTLFSCVPQQTVADNSPSGLPALGVLQYGGVATGPVLTGPQRRYDGRWTQSGGFPFASMFTFNVGGGSMRLAVARFMDAVPSGQSPWGMFRAMPLGTGTNNYTWGAVSVNPTYTAGGCLRSVAGSVDVTRWIGDEPNGVGGTDRSVLDYSIVFNFTLNTERCCGLDSTPDVTDAVDAMMRAQFGRPCQGCGQ